MGFTQTALIGRLVFTNFLDVKITKMQSGSIHYGGSKPTSERRSGEMNFPGDKTTSSVDTSTLVEAFEGGEDIVVASDDNDALNAGNKDENVNR